MLVSWIVLNAEEHLIAQVAFIVQPVFPSECCCLFAFRGHPSLEVFLLARLDHKALPVIGAVLKLIQTERVRELSFNFVSARISLGGENLDKAVFNVKGATGLCMFSE